MEFYIYLIIQLAAVTFYMTVFSVYSSCFIGLCTYFDAIMDDFSDICSKINREIIKHQICKTNELKTEHIFAELVQLHGHTLR